jgi:hypothetical protein
MELEMKAKTVIEIGYTKLEDFIRYVYNVDEDVYDFVADQECGNDCSITFNVDGKIDEWNEKRLQKFNNGEIVMNITRVLLNDMYRRGKIVAGEYLVKVAW